MGGADQDDLPLAGLRVLEFSHTVMGPTAGLLLADLGADVVKVEPAPEGDATRRLPGFAIGFFGYLNRNKRSFVVDLKTENLVGPLYDLIDRLRLHDRLIVGSFSDRRLREFRALAGGLVATSTGAASSRSWLMASRVGRGVRSEAAALQLPRTSRGVRVIDRRLIDAAHGLGLQGHVWTVNNPGEMAELLDLGTDGIITDRPDLLREVLVGRGLWGGSPAPEGPRPRG